MGKSIEELGFKPKGKEFDKRAINDPTIPVLRQKYSDRELAEAPMKFDNQNDFLYLIDPTRPKPRSLVDQLSQKKSSIHRSRSHSRALRQSKVSDSTFQDRAGSISR